MDAEKSRQQQVTNRNSTDEDDVVILAEIWLKSGKEKTKDDDEPMIVEELICVDGPVKESTRSDIIEPEEAFLDENAGPENPSRRMRTEERKNNKSHEGEYFETCDGVEEFMKKKQEKELLEGAVNVPESELKLRVIVVDGSNVAMALGKHKTFRVDALSTVYEHFAGRGHQVIILLPRSRWNYCNTEERAVLDRLFDLDVLAYTPTRRGDEVSYDCYDDRFMVEYAVDREGIIVTNDNYRDLITESAAFRDQIENRYRHSFRIISANHITSGCFLLPG